MSIFDLLSSVCNLAEVWYFYCIRCVVSIGNNGSVTKRTVFQWAFSFFFIDRKIFKIVDFIAKKRRFSVYFATYVNTQFSQKSQKIYTKNLFWKFYKWDIFFWNIFPKKCSNLGITGSVNWPFCQQLSAKSRWESKVFSNKCQLTYVNA